MPPGAGAKVELILKLGKRETIDILKAKVGERKKSGLSTKHLEEALEKLEERLKGEEEGTRR